MDTGEGRFEELALKESVAEKLQTLEEHRAVKELRNKYPHSKGIFHVGEEFEIKGSRFRVADISPFGIKLKLLPAKHGNVEEG